MNDNMIMDEMMEENPAHRLYKKGLRVYEVLSVGDSGTYATYFYHSPDDKDDPELVTKVATIAPADTEEKAQCNLDIYARKAGLEEYEHAEEPPYQSDDSGEDCHDDYPTEEEAADGDGLPEETDIPMGKRLSLRDSEFDSIIYTIDGKLNSALRTAIDARQGFALTAKISFVPVGGSFRIKHEIGYQFDPIKVKDKGELYEDIQIILDDQGYPIIPFDREHQLAFEESQGMTVSTDASGVIENIDYHEPDIYPCDNIDCPLYTGYSEKGSGCVFNPDDLTDSGLLEMAVTAINECDCTREVVEEFIKKEFGADENECD